MDTLTLLFIAYIVIIIIVIAIIAFIVIRTKTKSLAGSLTPNESKEPSVSSENSPGFVKNIGMPAIRIEANNQISEVNGAMISLLKHSENAIIGNPYQQVLLLTRENDSVATETISEAFKGNIQSFPEGIILEQGDGTKIPIEGYVVPNTDRSASLTLILHDATERNNALQKYKDEISQLQQQIVAEKSNEHNLTESFAQKENLVSFATLAANESWYAIAVIATDGTIAYLNHKAEQILDIFEVDYKDKPYKELIALFTKNGDRSYEAIEKGLGGQSAAFSRWTFLSTKQGKIPIIGMVSPLSSTNGFHGASVFFADASEEYADFEGQRSFFSAAAHDLRTPLTTLRAVVELLVNNFDSTSKEEAKKLLESANSSILHLISLVNDLLAVARIEQNRIEVKKESFDIYELTESIVKQQATVTREKRLFLSHPRPESGVPKVYADSMRTEEVIVNLLSNAIKYTHQGGITITHKVVDGMVRTYITDTGAGIAKENYGLLFKKFQQVSTARNQLISKSTGLGLYIAKEFATRMSGDLVLESSEPGVGSTFVFTLPIAPTNAG